MIDLVIAYRPNGCVVGLKTQYDYVNSVAASDELQGEALNEARATKCFGGLAAPTNGQINIRPVVVCRAFNVPEDIADECLELVNQVGGSDTGFGVAQTLEEFSDFDKDKKPMAFSVERPAIPQDTWHMEGEQAICTVCGEQDCGWMARNLSGN